MQLNLYELHTIILVSTLVTVLMKFSDNLNINKNINLPQKFRASSPKSLFELMIGISNKLVYK